MNKNQIVTGSDPPNRGFPHGSVINRGSEYLEAVPVWRQALPRFVGDVRAGKVILLWMQVEEVMCQPVTMETCDIVTTTTEI